MHKSFCFHFLCCFFILFLVSCSKDDPISSKTVSLHTSSQEIVTAGQDDLKYWRGDFVENSDNKKSTFSGTRDEQKNQYNLDYVTESHGGVQVHDGGPLGRNEQVPAEISAIQDPIQAFKEAADADKTGDYEKAYQLSKRALELYKGDERNSFVILRETLRRGAYLMSIYFSQLVNGDGHMEHHLYNLANEHIRMIENQGGLAKIIDTEEKIANVGLDDPLLRGDIENNFVLGYYILGMGSDKNTAVKYYNAIKNYSHDQAELLMRRISSQ